MMLYGVLVASMLMTVGMLFIPTGKKDQPVAEFELPQSGVIHLIVPERNEIYIQTPDAKKPEVVEFDPEADVIYLDDVKSDLMALKEGFLVSKIEPVYDRNGKLVKKTIAAVSQKTLRLEGLLTSVNTATGMVRVGQEDAENTDSDTPIYVPSTALIKLNGMAEQLGARVTLKQLQEGDRVTLEYQDEGERPEAITLSAERLLSATGTLVSLDPAKLTISLSNVEPPNEQREFYALSPDCVFSINELEFYSSGKKVTLGDLKSGDQVSLELDSKVYAVAASRAFIDAGIVRGVDAGNRTVDVFLERTNKVVPFRLDEGCAVVLKSDGSDRSLEFVRVGDKVDLTHDSPDSINATAQKIEVSPAANRDLWAIVVGIQNLDDNRLTKPQLANSDAAMIADTLTGYYRVPQDQILTLNDPTRLQLRQAAEAFVERVPQNGQLVVYFSGLGFLTDADQAVLATKEFNQRQMAQSGLSLRDWVDILEASQSQETLLLLDCCPTNARSGGQRAVSAVEMVESLMSGPGKPVSTSVTIITSCGKNERQGIAANPRRGLFAAALSKAVEGAADNDGDHLVTAKELNDFVDSEMDKLAQRGNSPQSTGIFFPDEFT